MHSVASLRPDIYKNTTLQRICCKVAPLYLIEFRQRLKISFHVNGALISRNVTEHFWHIYPLKIECKLRFESSVFTDYDKVSSDFRVNKRM